MNNSTQLVYIKCGEFDKYGRLLGELYLTNEEINLVNQMMIYYNHGYVYNVGTKKEF
jgi:hypothetical protein